MKPKLTLILALIVLTPLAIVGWLGAKIVQDEQVVLTHQLQDLMAGQLRSVDAVLVASMQRQRDAVLAEMRPLTADRDELRRRSRESALVTQFYVMESDGSLEFPPVAVPANLTAQEREALQRTRTIWDNGELLAASGRLQGDGRGAERAIASTAAPAGSRALGSADSVPAPPVSAADSLNRLEGSADAEKATARQKQAAPAASVDESGAEDGAGWIAWYWGNGLQLMLWARDGERIHAAEVNRARLLADLMGALPETDGVAPELAEGRIRLMDSNGRVLYQWGAIRNEESLETMARQPLSAPLSAWQLEYATEPGGVFANSVAGGFLLSLVTSLALIAAAVIGLSYYFYREQSREMREASQRVSFVNQVSHELKTPLTNIRMYAELLERDAPEGDSRMQRHLGVIVSESQRLSRLIANVLTFSRNQRQALKLRYQPGVPDEVLRDVVNHFRPTLEAKSIAVELDLAAAETVVFDGDALGQIAGNLIGNVEKYAADGKWLGIASRLTRDGSRDRIEVTVSDRGPGVPPRERKRVFDAFYRVSNSLTEGVSGTGIGLSISRELARLHGGDVELLESECGARFQVTLLCDHREATSWVGKGPAE